VKFTKTPIATSAANGGSPAAHSSPAAGATIPLRLSALVAPYRKDGTHLFRIEQMPRRSRLTIGRNNGNSTWTLNDREVDTVEYIPPPGAEDPPELSLRIIAMPSGQTLAVLDLPLSGAKHGHSSAATELSPKQRHKSEDAASDKGAAPEHNIALTTAEERTQARIAETLARETAIALKDAENIWKAEETARFARAQAQWHEETAKALAEARAGAAHGTKQDLEPALANVQRQGKTAEANRRESDELQWQKKLEAAVTAARDEAERQWQRKFDSAVAEARSEAATRLGTDNAEGQRLRSETAAARSTLAQREIELAAAREEVEKLHANLQRLVETALQQAGAKWNASETARRAEAEAQWREQTAKAVAEALASAEEARNERMQSELERLNAELSAARASLAGTKAKLAELESAFSRAQTDWPREKEAALSGAENAWRAAESVRLTVAKAEWQAQSDRALADARAETEAIRREYGASDRHRLREALAERENELTQLRAAFIEERGRLHREAAEQLVEAEKNWKLDEIARVNKAREDWQAQTAKAVADARTSAKPGKEMAADIELRRLRGEYTALQATLAARELELSRAKQAAGAPDDQIILRPQRIRPVPGDETNQKRDDSRRRGLGLSIALIAGIASCGVFLYPNFEDILQPAPQVDVSAPEPAPAGAPPTAPQPAPPAGKLAVVVRGANVRSAPSGDASVMLTLPRGTKVATLERQGNWTRIQVQSDDNATQPREGWIFTSFLKDADSP
jgi:hypothetical protein